SSAPSVFFSLSLHDALPIFVLLAMSWRFLRPYFLIAMMILTFWWSKKETKRLIFSKYSSGAIWLKYGSKKIGGSRNFSRFCLHWARLWSRQTWIAPIGQQESPRPSMG